MGQKKTFSFFQEVFPKCICLVIVEAWVWLTVFSARRDGFAVELADVEFLHLLDRRSFEKEKWQFYLQRKLYLDVFSFPHINEFKLLLGSLVIEPACKNQIVDRNLRIVAQ